MKIRGGLDPDHPAMRCKIPLIPLLLYLSVLDFSATALLCFTLSFFFTLLSIGFFWSTHIFFVLILAGLGKLAHLGRHKAWWSSLVAGMHIFVLFGLGLSLRCLNDSF